MDALGNEGQVANMSVVLDTTPPGKPAVTSTTHPSGSVWYNSTVVSLRWTAPQDATAIAGYSYAFTTGDSDTPNRAVMTTSTELGAPVPGEGRWHFRIMAVDGAGNWGAFSDMVILIDTRGPAPPAIQSPQDNMQTLPGPVQVAWNPASDALSGIKGYHLQLAQDAGFSSMAFEGTLDTTSYQSSVLEQGNYYWRVKACDGAGNWGEYGAAAVFTVRNPIPASVQPPAGALSSANPLMLAVAGVLLVAIIAGVAVAAARRRKAPPPSQEAYRPAQSDEQSPVQWEP